MSDSNNTKHQTLISPCLVVIKDTHPNTKITTNTVFPPHNHENLHAVQQNSVTSPSSPLDFNSWDPQPTSDVVRRESGGGMGWFGVAVRVLKTRFFGVVSERWCGIWGNWALWGFGLVLFWWGFVRRRRRGRRDGVERLRRVVEEKKREDYAATESDC